MAGPAAESEHGPVNQSQGDQDEEGRVKYGDEAHPLAGDSADDAPAGIGRVKAQREEEGKEDLQGGKGRGFPCPPVGQFAQKPAADGFQDEPAPQDEPNRQLVAEERHQQFPDQQALGHSETKAHQQEPKAQNPLHPLHSAP